MHLMRKVSVFIWFSFLYRRVLCELKSDVFSNSLASSSEEDLSPLQQQQLLSELRELTPDKRQKLFDELQKQRRDYERSRSKWTRQRHTLLQPDDLNPVSQSEIDIVRTKIRSGSVPVIRDKRTLKFLIKSLAEILGLRWTLLKYSMFLPLINNIVAPPASSTAPAAPPGKPSAPAPPAGAPKKPPAPSSPPKRLPPPNRPLPPPPPPPKRPPPPPPAPRPAAPAPPVKPAGPPARPAAPPTIPPNQIDPNTIRYPFRPAPTIPILNFAPLPQGVTVPYPPLFQWPTPSAPAAAPANPPAPKGPPQQPPCAAPPPAAPPAPNKPPPPPSRLPLPKPRPPQPPRPKPVIPSSNPGKTPLKLEYDQPIRIEIFNNAKPYLPVSGTVYSGNPTLASIEQETEHYENPTQTVIQAINEQYNTESNEANKDYDYGFYTPSHLNIESDPETTPYKVVDYYDNHQNYEDTTVNHKNYYNNDYNNNQYGEETEESTTAKYNSFYNNAYNDYPEQVEENRAHYHVKTTTFPKYRQPKRVTKRIKKPKKYAGSNAEESKIDTKWDTSTTPRPSYVTPVSVFSTSTTKRPNRLVTSIRRHSTTTEFPQNHSKIYRKASEKNSIISENNISSRSKFRSAKRPYTSITRSIDTEKPKNEFRIIVPHSRRRRDIFFDDAFKNFNLSFRGFKAATILPRMDSLDDLPVSTQSQFLDLHGNGQLSPNEEYRQQLEKDVEKYVEKYVEEQISHGVINPNKPKTTIVELKTRTGPPIKTVTTTLSKLIEGDKSLLEGIIEFSKEINPVSADLGKELSGVDPNERSEVSQAFVNDHFKDAFNSRSS